MPLPEKTRAILDSKWLTIHHLMQQPHWSRPTELHKGVYLVATRVIITSCPLFLSQHSVNSSSIQTRLKSRIWRPEDVNFGLHFASFS